jgi:hypothetical protein
MLPGASLLVSGAPAQPSLVGQDMLAFGGDHVIHFGTRSQRKFGGKSAGAAVCVAGGVTFAQPANKIRTAKERSIRVILEVTFSLSAAGAALFRLLHIILLMT